MMSDRSERSRRAVGSPARDAVAPRPLGTAGYDALDDREQDAVRASWDEQIAARIDGLVLADRLRAAGRPWPEADADGHIVMVGPLRPA